MEPLKERFRYLDSRFFPYLETVLNRLPQEVKEGILEHTDFQLIADSLLEELVKGRTSAAAAAKGRTTSSSASPRRAVLAGIMSALKEIELQERYSPRVCEMVKR